MRGGDARAQGAASPQDSLNRDIIRILQQDGRTPFAEMALALGVSEGTIRNRVNGMKKSGLLRIVAITDPVLAEYKADAMLGIKIAPGTTPEAVAERLGASAEVVYVLWVSGRFDLLVEIVCDDEARFLAFLSSEIHDRDDIAAVETMTGLKNFKNQFLLKSDWG